MSRLNFTDRISIGLHHDDIALTPMRTASAAKVPQILTVHDNFSLSSQSVVTEEEQVLLSRAIATEKELTFFACCRRYPKATAWSLLLFLTITMEAFDKSLLGGLFATPAFRIKFGQSTSVPNASITHEISPAIQIGLQNTAVVSEIAGLLGYGYIADILGYRKTMMASLVWLLPATLPALFATHVSLLLLSQAFCGISWGVFQTLAATYAADVIPATMRAFMLSNVNMCWLTGQLLGTGILRVLVNSTSEWAYRLPFALQSAWAVPLLIGVYFAPDSPWWFIRHNRTSDARRALGRLCGKNQHYIDNTIAIMKHTNRLEKNLKYGGATYTDLFRGSNRRRTEISCIAWVCQAMCGSTLTAYAPYFFEQAGLGHLDAFNFSLGMYGVGILGNIAAWGLLQYVGRRKLYLGGLLALSVLLAVGGIGATVLRGSHVANWALGSLIAALTFAYSMTIGPVCYIYVAEIPATRLRVKTVAFARVIYNVAIIISNILALEMLNPTAWNLGGKTCFLYLGTALCCLVWCYFRLPETKGLSYLELDILFELKAPTRKFAVFQKHLENSPYLSVTNAERLGNNWHGWLGYS
ncbi:hypothetical protein QQS21_001960 [Conoideocrella luteorostrata]|uniref:Major facilitator superfamily (MFS) profile domain-containing protein n=1 Tax=Conoideocrella luteorostrata TaxID=1105319 RepID=A0AAJ0CW23_9HYPO|nr:hypothetical protein QQS21_001960 [Conoideocrella luteorostrata]